MASMLLDSPRPTLALDDALLLVAIVEELAARQAPRSLDQIELALWGLSSDWLARKLTAEMRRHGHFALVERYLGRWRRNERSAQRTRLDALVALALDQGLVTWLNEGGRDRFLLRPIAEERAAAILADAITESAHR
jgi:hypothetical protein